MAHFKNGNVIVADLKTVDGVDVSVLGTTVSTLNSKAILKDGSVAFTSAQTGVTPTADGHLTTKGYVDGLINGLDWQESVLDRYDPTSGLPIGSTGDRYISLATANGWTINNIYEYNGSSWDEIIPTEGAATWVEDEDKQVVYNGTNWINFGSTNTHNNLSGLNVGDYQHLTLANHTDLTDGNDSTLHYHSSDRNLSNAIGTIDDTKHGDRSGGSLHALAAAGTSNGFMSAADKTKLDTYQSDGSSYILVDGTRSFSGVVGGVTPVLDNHLATKGYIDNSFLRSDIDDETTGKITFNQGDPGAVSAHVNADELVIKNNGITGISLLSPDVNSGNVYFGSPTGGNNMIRVSGFYNAGDPALIAYLADVEKFRVDGVGIDVTGTMAATTVTGANVTSGEDPGHTHTSSSLTNLTENIQDITGGMFSGNTETGISATYEDVDGTIDLVVTYGVEPGVVSSNISGSAGSANSASRSDHSHDLGVHAHDASSSGGTIDHGALTGRNDDDHTIYSLVDGTRSFSAVVAGVTPTDSTHLATKGYVDGLISGLDWQESVLDRTTNALATTTTGNRYISTNTSGGWTINNIYEYNGSSWDEIIPTEGAATWVEAEDKQYVYNGINWVTFGSTSTHNNLNGLNDGDYKHLSAIDYTDLTDNGDSTLHYHSSDRNLTNSTGDLPAARFTNTSHGNRSGGSLHAAVIAGGANGFMTGIDKTKLDTYQSDGSAYIRSNTNDIVTGNTTWNDNDYIYLGTGNDLALHHNGTDSYISNAVGTLYVQSNGESAITIVPNGAVKLYRDNLVKLETTTNGVSVTGTMAATTVTGINVTSGIDPGHTHTAYLASGATAVNSSLLDNLDSTSFLRSDSFDTVTSGGTRWNDNIKIELGSADNFDIYHNSNNYIESSSTESIFIRGKASTSAENMAVFRPDGAAELYYNNSKKIETTTDGATVTGNLYVTGSIDGGQL